MVVSDPIGDFLTQIRNAQMAGHDSVEIHYSKLRGEIVKILEKEGYVAGYKRNEKQPVSTLTLVLKYGPEREPVIRHLESGEPARPEALCGQERNPTSSGRFGN